MNSLAQRFSIKDFGPFTYFVGVEVIPYRYGILLSQQRYIMDLLAHTKMINAKPVLTPLPITPTLTLHSGSALPTPLNTEPLSQPNISFVVNKLSQFMYRSTIDDWFFVKRLLRYLCGTSNHGILLSSCIF